jgi:hypothetical protein
MEPKMTPIQQLEYQDYLRGCREFNLAPNAQDFADGDFDDRLVDYVSEAENARRAALRA